MKKNEVKYIIERKASEIDRMEFNHIITGVEVRVLWIERNAEKLPLNKKIDSSEARQDRMNQFLTQATGLSISEVDEVLWCVDNGKWNEKTKAIAQKVIDAYNSR